LSIQISGLINIWVVSDSLSAQSGKSQAGDRASSSIVANTMPVSSANIGFLGGDEGISWTPDNRIVFISASGKQGDIWIMNADASNRKQLTFDAGNNHNPVVSPDGRYIVFTSTRAGNRNVWRMNIDGSDPKRLTDGIVDLQPSFTPDGRWVIYSSLASGDLRLWKVPFEGGAPIKVLDKTGSLAVVSPDGRQIAYLYTEEPAQGPPNKIAIIPFEGGEALKTFDVPRAAAGARTILKWNNDGNSLYYSAIANNASNIWRLPLDGGKPVQVTNFTEHIITAFDWSRDGHRLAVSRGVLIRDVVLINSSQ
jgi:TolB protein